MVGLLSVGLGGRGATSRAGGEPPHPPSRNLFGCSRESRTPLSGLLGPLSPPGYNDCYGRRTGTRTLSRSFGDCWFAVNRLSYWSE